MNKIVRIAIAALAALVLLIGTAPAQIRPTTSDIHRQFAGPDWPEGG